MVATAVDFQLRLTHTSKNPPSAPLPLQVGPAAHKPRRRVLKLCELDLELTFVALRALGENVEDQPRTVDDRAAERLFEVALLHRRQVVVEYRERSMLLLQSALDFLDFSRAGKKGGVGPIAAPADQGSRTDSGADGEKSKFFHAFGVAARAEIQAHQHPSDPA